MNVLLLASAQAIMVFGELITVPTMLRSTVFDRRRAEVGHGDHLRLFKQSPGKTIAAQATTAIHAGS